MFVLTNSRTWRLLPPSFGVKVPTAHRRFTEGLIDRGKAGSKIHVLSDRAGIPLSVAVSAANTNDSYALKTIGDSDPSSLGPSHQLGHHLPVPRGW
jgi:hypothetical protein